MPEAVVTVCLSCQGKGQVFGWLIPGYGWGTVKGVKNRKDWRLCRCCGGSGKHTEDCDHADA